RKSVASAACRAPGAGALGCECPPASAFGRRLLLYFAPKGTRPQLSNLRGGPKGKNETRLPASPRSDVPVRPAGLRGEYGTKAPLFGKSATRRPGAGGRPSGRNKGGGIRRRRMPGD